MARCVDDDVLALLRVKPDLRRVDRDILVAFGLETVHQVGPLKRNAAPFGDALQLLQLAFRQRAGVVKKPPDEGALAMIDMADNHDL